MQVLIFLIISIPFSSKAQSSGKEVSVINESFITYMKAVMNPYQYGLKDEKFYPYSTRYGKRIGWGLEVKEKSQHKNGIPAAQADADLKAGLEAMVAPLSLFLKKNYEGAEFSRLGVEAKQILLDRAFTEGIENLPDDFCKAVLSANWGSLIKDYLYIRKQEGWPDITRNHAFAQRWIFGKTGPALQTNR